MQAEAAVTVTKWFVFYTIGRVKTPLPVSVIPQAEWLISKCGRKESQTLQLATTCCRHSRRNGKRRFY